ncbi:hypothetical protein AVEN_257346-1 [Araneus ventricosus]|uniref:Uncharacterized protein n=1 Tax=Araneus ventricosus TaxID=182803 RepID=A0A4Y2C8Z0_ARAVE|nr:hypothetical protein AVEN_257346-1 [Araneus ventricosus]
MILTDFLPQFYQGRVCKYAARTGTASSRFCDKLAEGRLAHDFRFNVHQRHTCTADFQWKSGFEPRALPLQSRDLATRPPQPFLSRKNDIIKN